MRLLGFSMLLSAAALAALAGCRGEAALEVSGLTAPVIAPGHGARAPDEGSAEGRLEPTPTGLEGPPPVERARPDAVVMALFGAASDGDPELLAALCAPDERARCSAIEFAAFRGRFASGEISGPAVFAADGLRATIEVRFAARGDTETIPLVKIDGQWFVERLPELGTD